MKKILLSLLALASVTAASADDETRGIGQYPGRPSENFAPTLVKDNSYRNLALNRMARASSSFDHNLTAQLATDGIIGTGVPPTLEVKINGKLLSKREREWTIDANKYSRNILMGATSTLEFHWDGMVVDADSVRFNILVAYEDEKATRGYDIFVREGDSQLYRESKSGLPGTPLHYTLHSDPNKQTDKPTLPGRVFTVTAVRNSAEPLSNLLLHLNMPGAEYWQISDVDFFKAGRQLSTELQTSERFESAWMSAGENAEEGEWLSVDLGDVCNIDKVNIYWGSDSRGTLQVSDDEVNWITITELYGTRNTIEEHAVTKNARYVRLSLDTDVNIVREFEVYGKGGYKAKPHDAPVLNGKTLSLNGGDWRVMRASEVRADGAMISRAGFDARKWIVATVPGTVLTSYANVGAVLDQNYDDNIYQTSESFFNSNFWYRRDFDIPVTMPGKHIFLNLDGINWKAQVWVNGRKAGRVEGAFMRGNIDITSLVHSGRNAIAIEIEKNDHPGNAKVKNSESTDINGGLLGADNPTFHATVGWDWITSVRGRDIGIWNDVYLTAEKDITLYDPMVITTLNQPDTLATVTPGVIVRNNIGKPVSGKLKGRIGDITFEKECTIKMGQYYVSFSPEEFPQLKDQALRLWWPNGYGEPYLYDASFTFEQTDGSMVDNLTFKAGIRQMTWEDETTRLKLYVNGRRFIPLGGNWGFPEHNLNYRAREYDTAVKYHRDMNFNMIRNWVGQTGDEEFYEACDKYGIMVWQDFWLANPADGPDPYDNHLFGLNADDYIRKIRIHPSIAFYCGRNEGVPPEFLDKTLSSFVKGRHPGMLYISDSAAGGVSGHGPYRAIPVKEYFELSPGKLHSERGMPNVMTYEGLSRTLRPEHLWPQSDFWGQHDFTQKGAQRGTTFTKMVNDGYGRALSAEEFCRKAQFVNYDGYRAMYESCSRDRMGMIIWMSHACWPSMTWQCYDYYFEPTAAFFGCKKACEPLHIQYNALTRKVEVVNLCKGDKEKLQAEWTVMDVNGKVLAKGKRKVSSKNDSTVALDEIAAPAVEGAYFLKLVLKEKKTVVSDNFYILTTKEGDYRALNNLGKIELDTKVQMGDCKATVTLENKTGTPAILIRLNLKDGEGSQILPVDYSDNYFHLMPGEKKTVNISWLREDQHAEGAVVEVSCEN